MVKLYGAQDGAAAVMIMNMLKLCPGHFFSNQGREGSRCRSHHMIGDQDRNTKTSYHSWDVQILLLLWKGGRRPDSREKRKFSLNGLFSSRCHKISEMVCREQQQVSVQSEVRAEGPSATGCAKGRGIARLRCCTVGQEGGWETIRMRWGLLGGLSGSCSAWPARLLKSGKHKKIYFLNT